MKWVAEGRVLRKLVAGASAVTGLVVVDSVPVVVARRARVEAASAALQAVVLVDRQAAIVAPVAAARAVGLT